MPILHVVRTIVRAPGQELQDGDARLTSGRGSGGNQLRAAKAGWPPRRRGTNKGVSDDSPSAFSGRGRGTLALGAYFYGRGQAALGGGGTARSRERAARTVFLTSPATASRRTCWARLTRACAESSRAAGSQDGDRMARGARAGGDTSR